VLPAVTAMSVAKQTYLGVFQVALNETCNLGEGQSVIPEKHANFQGGTLSNHWVRAFGKAEYEEICTKRDLLVPKKLGRGI
jgi:hypothetical protein